MMEYPPSNILFSDLPNTSSVFITRGTFAIPSGLDNSRNIDVGTEYNISDRRTANVN